MSKLRFARATKNHADLHVCGQCDGTITRGEAVLVLQQSRFVPFYVRTLVYHDCCVRDVLPRNRPREVIKRAKVPEVAVVKQEIAAVYHHKSRAQTLAWLEETAPDSDLMRWAPTDSLSE